MEPHRLPIGIQTFRCIRESGMYYVDKTKYAHRMSSIGKHYFLSRPRRFGKSLFASMLKEMYKGSEELFQGLYIHDHWDWTVRYPVVSLDFSGGENYSRKGLNRTVNKQLKDIEEREGLHSDETNGPLHLFELIGKLHEKYGQPVVVLVDEYDAPVLDSLDDMKAARAVQKYLRSLYGTLKQRESIIRFSFLTGITRFTRMSLFSKLNNILDISLDPAYSSICGYTDSDIDDTFRSEMAELSRDRIRRWYNGYSWLGEEKVYNPFDILLLLLRRKFKNWWGQTGSPEFLIKALEKRGVFSLDYEFVIDADVLDASFDIDEIDTRALLFQTGYLTISEEFERSGNTYYRLCYPNREVAVSLNLLYLRNRLPQRYGHPAKEAATIRRYLLSKKFGKLKKYLKSVFSGIPFQWHTRIDIARHEAYVASLFYSIFKGANMDVRVEDSTSLGRMDMAVVDRKGVFIFEFKVVRSKPTGKALKQLRRRKYADKFRHLGLPIYLVGVEFSSGKRNIVAFDVVET